MSIIRVSELNQTTGITPSSFILTSHGDSNPRTSKYITKDDLFNELATTGSNVFVGNQNITGSLTVSGLTAGSFSDSAVVINPITNLFGTMPQGLRTTYGLFSQTGDSVTVSGTTTESSLIGGGIGTLSVPINGFSVGDSFRADFGGILNVGNNQTIRIRLKTGSVILADSGPQVITQITNDIWSLSVNFTIRQIGVAGAASIVTLGGFHYSKTNNGSVEGFSWNTVNNTTFNTTVNNTLDVTAEWGSTSVSNQIYSDIFVLNKIY